MNTLLELNVPNNVNYNNEADYAIVFGANAGNTTANVDLYATANITKQTSLTSISDAVRDLLIDVQFSNVGVVSMQYAGTWSNIGLLQITPAAWRVNGIRSVVQYNEAFANVKYTDLTGVSYNSGEYAYITTVNDQAGNTRTWTTTVNVIEQPTLAVSGNVIYNEDTATPVTQVTLDVEAGTALPFRLTANIASAYGTLSNGVVSGNSIYLDGNSTSINDQIASGGIVLLPASDFVSNVANAIGFTLTQYGNVISTANANLQIGTAHNEYSLTTSYGYAEDVTVPMVFDITDLDTHATGFVSTFAQTSGPTSQFYVNGVAQGYGNSAVLSNSKANINVANVSFLPYPDSTANIGLTYSQVKILPSGNVTQASNVAISLTNTSSENQYSLPSTGTYVEDTLYSFGNTITDTDIRAQSYTIVLQQTSGNAGQFYRSGNLAVSNAYSTWTISDSKANINNTIEWKPPVDYIGNVVFTYTQSKLNVFGNTQVQANAVTATRSCSSTNPEISNMIDRTYTTNNITQLFSTSTPYINDGPDYGQSYTITLNSSIGKFGNTSTYFTSGAWGDLANTYSFTGNTTLVNSNFANIRFAPTQRSSGNSTFTYTQSRDGVAQVNVSKVLTANVQAFTGANTYTFTTSGNVTPTFIQSQYGLANVLIVAGGGGGGGNCADINQGGGGGGGGEVKTVTFASPLQSTTTIPVTIGSGGSPGSYSSAGSQGGNTTVVIVGNTYTATGGGGGYTGSSCTGGDYYGTPGYYGGAGGLFLWNLSGGAGTYRWTGGGGAGASANGTPASQGSEAGNVRYPIAGVGGNGISSSLSGSTVYYGGGGGGAFAGGAGGVGGGGAGGTNLTDGGANGTPNTGGGGGGAGKNGQGAGGSGIVIIKIS
jgi:hypothetical protein